MARPQKRKRPQVDPGDRPILDGSTCIPVSNKRRCLLNPVTNGCQLHPSTRPPHFWDNLSEIPLTSSALLEVERRNTQRPGTDSGLRRSRRSSRLLAQQAAALIQSPNQLLKQYASEGGPDLRDLRGYKMPPSSSLTRRHKRASYPADKTNAPPTTTSTKSTGPYDRAFQQHLIDHQILPDEYEDPDGRGPPPISNIDDIKQILRQPRPSLSLSAGDFKEFKRAQAHASKESQILADVFPFLEGNAGDKRCIGRQIPFNNLEHLTDGTLAAANPDIYHGARPEQLPYRLRERLSGQIEPSSQGDLPLAPNFFVEVKGPDGSAAVAQRQINYDMALGERGQVALHSSGSPQPNNIEADSIEAHTLGCTYMDGTLKVYAIAMLPPKEEGQQPGYTIVQLKACAMTGDSDAFLEGVTVYRNAVEWCKKQRDKAIEKAKTLATDLQDRPSFTEQTSRNANKLGKGGTPKLVRSQYDLESADELSLDYSPPAKRSRSPQKQQGKQLGNNNQPPAKRSCSPQKQQAQKQQGKPLGNNHQPPTKRSHSRQEQQGRQQRFKIKK
ncbi:unnamed protein product [Clonostachys chloroleuca]|uniref:Uncharacterized protein n=1 Tax=Clonostachys chloroleuca TaxID=1926264 RepID=A0AA35LTD6_9HYPO|nr:unnamed protein product [Clonostachys chloroleuca]